MEFLTRVFSHKEIIAVIIRTVIKQFHDWTNEEIMECISNVSGDTEISSGMTNTENTEMGAYKEYTTKFDILVSVNVPERYRYKVEDTEFIFKLRLNVEMQRNAKPDYNIASRGVFYGSRLISSQINVVTKKETYKTLQPCYSIWIVLGNHDKSLNNKVVEYGIQNITRMKRPGYLDDVARKDLNWLDSGSDLMHLVYVFLDKEAISKKEFNEYEIDDDIVEFLKLMFQNDFYSERMEEKYLIFSQGLGKDVYSMNSYMTEMEYEKALSEEIGEARGEERGEERINLLTKKLLESGRMDDLKKSLDDKDFQKSLLKEFGIE